jgi:hypothetical protein
MWSILTRKYFFAVVEVMNDIDPNLDIAPIDAPFFGSGAEEILPTSPLGWMFMVGFLIFFGYIFWKTWKEGGFNR